MAFSLTALQLVNRVRRRMRHDDVTALAELRDLASLDAINRAMREVLLAKVWEFDKRHTQMALKARITGVAGTFTSGASSGSISKSGLSASDVYGDFITRFLPSSSSQYGDTALRVLTASTPSADASTVTIPFAVSEAISVTAGEIFYSEYILADTIRSILTVSHQDESLTLEQVGSQIEFAELFPKQHIEYGEPKSVSVGGLDLKTYNAGSSAPIPSLRMIVWPPPDDEYVLDVDYLYRHPELTTATSTLDGVTDEAVDSIVDLATADMQQNYDQNTDEGRALRRDSMERLDNVHKAHGGQVAERAVIGNWDGSAGRSRWRHGLIGGRTIGS